MSLVKIKDTISPDLLAKARACNEPQRYLQAMGTAVVSLARRAFVEDGLRPSTWAPRKQPLFPRPSVRPPSPATALTSRLTWIVTERWLQPARLAG